MFHDFQMQQSRLTTNLKEALAFQKNFTQVVCVDFDARFKDNNVIFCFKILNPTKMPPRQVVLQN